MGRTKRKDDDVAVIAWLSERLGKRAIADMLGCSQRNIDEIFKAALSRGYLRERPQTRYEFAASEETEKRVLELLVPSAKLKAVIRDRVQLANRQRPKVAKLILPSIQVFLSTPGLEKPDDDGWDEALVAFSKNGAAAACLELLSRRGHHKKPVGIAWGRHLFVVVRDLIKLISGASRVRPHFLPIWGQPLSTKNDQNPSKVFSHPSEWSSTVLSGRLNAAFGSHEAVPISLELVPGIIPLRFSGTELTTLKRYVSTLEGFRQVYGSKFSADEKNPLTGEISECKAILLTVGSPMQSGRWLERMIDDAGAYAELLEADLIGDIGGVLIPRAEISAKPPGIIGKIADAWTGPTEEDLISCNNKAREKGDSAGAGVVALAVGRVRAPIVLAGIDRGLLSHVLMDHHCARALLSELGVALPGPEFLKQGS